MKILLALCCAVLLLGCQDNTQIPKIINHEVWIETSSTYTSSMVKYQVGTLSGSTYPGSLKFENIQPGTSVGVTVTGSNSYTSPNSGNVSATIYLDGVLWRSGSVSPGYVASLSISGVVPD